MTMLRWKTRQKAAAHTMPAVLVLWKVKRLAGSVMYTFLGLLSAAPCDGVVMEVACGKEARTTSQSGRKARVIVCRAISGPGGLSGGPGGSSGRQCAGRGGGGGVSHK